MQIKEKYMNIENFQHLKDSICPKNDVILEIDGYNHFVQYKIKRRQNLNKENILKKMGFQVHSIDIYEIRKLKYD